MQVGVRELKTNLSRYLDRVQHGEVVEVSSRGKLVARLVPAGPQSDIPSGIAQMIAEGKIIPATKPFLPTMPAVKLRGEGPTLADIVSELRD